MRYDYDFMTKSVKTLKKKNSTPTVKNSRGLIYCPAGKKEQLKRMFDKQIICDTTKSNIFLVGQTIYKDLFLITKKKNDIIT